MNVQAIDISRTRHKLVKILRNVKPLARNNGYNALEKKINHIHVSALHYSLTQK
jgi:hypothetical protein